MWIESGVKERRKMDVKRRRTGEEGVALIVVLGFLSLMLVMAVAFLRTSVTEQMVSDYSLEAIRSRQVLRSGLYAAMNDYSRELWSEKLYLPDEDYQVFASEASGLDRISGSAGTLKGSQVQMLRGEVLDWIPARYRTQDTTNAVNNAEWVLVREEPGSKSRILGRYAYVCFDCSGALDANFVALDDDVGKGDSRAMTNRMRRSIRDVPMGLLPELAEAGQFKSYRRGWKGFDSPQMLVKLTDGKAEDGNGSSARWQTERKETHGPGLASNLVSELTSYSLSAYRGGRYSRSGGTWEQPSYLPRTNWSSTIGWKAALSPIYSQFTQVDDDSFLKMVKDFTTDQVWPEGVNYPLVKNVPMFNEITVRNLHLNAPTDKGGEAGYEYKATVEVQFEFWFPFPSEDDEVAGNFTLEAPSLSMSSYTTAANIAMPVALVTSGGTIITVDGEAEPSPAKLDVKAKWNGGKPYVTEAIKYTVTFTPKSAEKFPDGCKLMWRQGWETKAPIDLKYGENAVDRLPSGISARVSGSVVVEAGQTHDKKYAKEALDPRLNHLTSDWQDAANDEGSPDAINDCTKNHIDFVREGEAMYCRNGPFDSPADFGFFPTGAPWKTLDLLNDNGAKFLALDEDIDEALKNKGVFYTNAQLNINTRCTNALASAFYELSNMEVPGWDANDHEGEDFVDEETARELARLIGEVTASQPFQSGMDWAALPVLRDNGWLAAQGYNRNQREALLRNTYGLFSVADSLFLVVVVAQSVKEGPESSKVGTWDDEDQITGERRGVALVWRDPFKTGTNPHHEMMVRMFRYLND